MHAGGWHHTAQTHTFCGANGCVVALRLPDTQLDRKGFGILTLLLSVLLLLKGCESAAAWRPLGTWLPFNAT